MAGSLLAALLAVLLASATSPTPASAQSPLAEARTLFDSYHEDPARLDRARDLLEEMIRQDPQPEAFIFLARVYLAWGDVRAKDREEKLSAYERGRDLAKRAVELAPRNVDAHLWYAANVGRWGQTKGVLRSLFLIPTLKEEIRIILELDPKSAQGHGLAGVVYMEVPGLFGGDLDKAEEELRKGLALDPRATNIRVDLARLLVKKERYEEARRELRKVLEEKNPRVLSDYMAKHKKAAEELLESLKAKS